MCAHEKPWIDVLTLSIARGLTRPCIESLLEAMKDRMSFYLRWVCHLDAHPRLAPYYDQEVSDIRATARGFDESTPEGETSWIRQLGQGFDDTLIVLSSSHQGFGPSLYRLLLLCENDAIWTCDDWDWTRRSFLLDEVREQTKDCYSFVTARTKAGALSPAFYRKHVFDDLRKCLAERGKLESVSENTCFDFLKHRYEMRGSRLLTYKENHPGLARMEELGFTHNCFGQKLGVLVKPRWSNRQGRFLER